MEARSLRWFLLRTGQCPGRCRPHGDASDWEEEKRVGIVCAKVWGCIQGCGSVLRLKHGQHAYPPPPDAQDESTKGVLTMQRASQRKLLSGTSDGAPQG